MEVLTPSPDRVEPLCPVARPVRWLQIQAMSYEAQLAFKTRKVESNLKRIGKFEEIPMESIIGMEDPFHYRNKAQFPFGKNGTGKSSPAFTPVGPTASSRIRAAIWEKKSTRRFWKKYLPG